jgi:tetratricopeptide (TPR) repeat protein
MRHGARIVRAGFPRPAVAGTLRLAGLLVGVHLLAWAGGGTVPAEAADRDPAPDLPALCIRLNRIQEPEIPDGALEKALEELTGRARKALDGIASPDQRVARLNEVLLTGRQVSYLSNLYWRDSTLSASLLRGRGNCLSTTTLYVVVGRRLDLPLRAVLVPRHAHVRYDDGTAAVNIETTAGGARQPDEAYHLKYPFAAPEKRLLGYGRSLADREFAAVLEVAAGHHLVQVDRAGDAQAHFAEAVRLWPGNPSVELARLGGLYADRGKREEALAGFRALAATCESPEVRTLALLALAGELQSRTDHPGALALLAPAWRFAPRHLQGGVLASMASSYRSLRRFDEALAVMRLGAILEDEAEVYTGLAIFAKNAGRLEDAIWALQRSLEKNPESWDTRLILAGYLIRAGRDEEGWAMFKTVEKPRVNLEYYETNLAWFYGSVGRKAECLDHLGRALEMAKTPHLLDYIRTEVDFDRYRNDADFQALVAKHRERLLGGAK